MKKMKKMKKFGPLLRINFYIKFNLSYNKKYSFIGLTPRKFAIVSLEINFSICMPGCR